MKTEINPVQHALEEFTTLHNECEGLKVESAQLREMNVGLMQENRVLQERLRDVEEDRDFLKSYCFEIVARMDVVVETIDVAKEKARQFAAAPRVVRTPVASALSVVNGGGTPLPVNNYQGDAHDH